MLGQPRIVAVAFSINGKGYVTNGYGTMYLNDIWEYNPITNNWSQKAPLPAVGRQDAVGFSICGKGYVGSGGLPYLNDFWEFDPLINQWTQKLNIPGPSRDDCAYFTAYNKGYVGLGNDGGSSPKSLWEYTPDSACVTGIDEVENYKLEILIAPNPATEFILVSFLSYTSKDVEVTIEDSNARIIYSKKLNLSIETSVKISISDFRNGIYFFKAKQTNRISVSKFVKQ